MKTSTKPFVFLSVLAFAGCKSSEQPSSTSAVASQQVAASSTAPAASSVARSPAPTHSGAVKPHPYATAVVTYATAGNDALASEPSLDPAKVGLPKADFGAPGPLVIKGYPTPVDAGMRDLATWIGYSKDDKQVIACGHMSPISADKGDEKGNTCFVHDGKTTKELYVTENGDHRYVGAELGAAITALKEGQSKDLTRTNGNSEITPPAVMTTWPYASDIQLDVTTIPPSEGSGILRVGGHYAKEEPVYSVSLAFRPSTPMPGVMWDAVWNGILQNPSNTELAFIGHFFCMEWCNDLVIKRVRYDELASLVYNDTGFRHHQKKDYTASRDLFLKATWANPRAPLPPYNLACAYALLGDATNSEKALKLAIAVAGDKVKARAKKDSDFKSVLSAPWFKALTD